MNKLPPVEWVSCKIIMHFTSENETAEALSLLRSSLERTLSMNGCVDCRALIDPCQPVRIEYLEQWETEAAFKKHVVSTDFKHVFFAMDMSCEVPDVKIERVVEQSGMEYLRTAYDEGIGLVTGQWQVSPMNQDQSKNRG
jgi:quinol monooxygenase YgiN